MRALNAVLHVTGQVDCAGRGRRAGWARGWQFWLTALALALGLNASLGVAAAQTAEPEAVESGTVEPGTVVTLLPPDLIGAYATAVVGEDHRLVFEDSLDPETEVRVLIMPPGAETASSPPYGRVSPSGDDIYIQFEGATQAVSLRYWLSDAYGVDLIFGHE